MSSASAVATHRRVAQLVAALVAFTIAWSPLLSAHATFSIVAADRATGQVGGAGSSCVGRNTISQIYGSAPGHGVVHAQALFSGVEMRLPEAVRLLSLDLAPAEIIAALTDPSFDPSLESRQYGIVDLAGRTAAFTGINTLPFAGDIQGETSELVYSAQGNILTGRDVLTEMEAGFRDPSACDLADRLMRALEAGGTGDIGDSRCTDRGIPSDGAFIQVDPSGQAPATYLLLQIDDTAPDDPLVLLRAMFDDWRRDNPCVVAPPPPPPMRDAGVERDAGVDAAAASDGAIDDVDATSTPPPPDAAPPSRTRESGCAAARFGADDARITGWRVVVLAAIWIVVSRRRRGLV